jgi:hypothetical protein
MDFIKSQLNLLSQRINFANKTFKYHLPFCSYIFPSEFPSKLSCAFFISSGCFISHVHLNFIFIVSIIFSKECDIWNHLVRHFVNRFLHGLCISKQNILYIWLLYDTFLKSFGGTQSFVAIRQSKLHFLILIQFITKTFKSEENL